MGFGSKLVWGAGGKAVNAPAWLKFAAAKGWGDAAPAVAQLKARVGRNMVISRNGLKLRGGPGLGFDHTTTLKSGTELTVRSLEGPGGDWALVDLEDDGQVDGFVFAAFLAPVADPENAG